MRSRALLLLAATLALAAIRCSVDQGPVGLPSGTPGQLTLVVRSPNGPEGAALLEVDGGAVTGVTGDASAVWTVRSGTRLRIAIVRATPGELRAAVAVLDTTAKLEATLVQVAGPSNELRGSLTAYGIEVVR